MVQGAVGTYTSAKQINDLTKLKEEAIKQDGIESVRVEIIDKMLKDVTDTYKSNVEVSKKATKAFITNDKKSKEEKQNKEKLESGDFENTNEGADSEISVNGNTFLSLDIKM